MAKQRRLTDAYIKKSVKAPSSGQEDHFDSAAPGLALRVSALSERKREGGSKTPTRTWVYVYRFAGKQHRLTYGRYPDVTIERARELAAGDRKLINQGTDPKAAREAEARAKAEAELKAKREAVNTFKAFADRFIEEYAKDEQPKTWERSRYDFNRYVLPDWGKRPIKQITRQDCKSLIARIKKDNGPYAANNVRSLVRKAFAWACAEDILDVNPMQHVARPIKAKAARRQEILSATQIVKVWRASDSLEYPFGPFVKMLFLTAQRRNEVANLKWPALDMTARVWTLAKADTKAGRAQTVPLSNQAMDILKSLPRFVPGVHVFSTTHGARPVSGFSKVKKRLDTLSGVKGWRLHDIRRTVASGIAEELGVPEEIVGKILNHAPKGVTGQVYIVGGGTKKKAGPLQAWADHIDALLAEHPAEAANK